MILFRHLKSFKSFIFILLIVLNTQSLHASEFATQIKNASFDKHKGWYLLNANVIYQLSPTAIDAIQSNIPLTWHLKVEVKKVGMLWNDTLIKNEYSYMIRYHALLNSYSVVHQNTVSSRRFASLTLALEAMSKIEDLKILSIAEIDKNSDYIAAIKVQFDREALPLPLRPVAYLDSEWDLSSDWYIWNLKP